MNKYKFTIKHDDGTHRLSTFAENLSAALNNVMMAEKFPERAIVNIKIEEYGNTKTKREKA